MGFIVEAFINWFWVGLINRLAQRYPPWIWVPIMISPLVLAFGGLYLVLR
jgi:hypothetical protein